MHHRKTLPITERRGYTGGNKTMGKQHRECHLFLELTTRETTDTDNPEGGPAMADGSWS